MGNGCMRKAIKYLLIFVVMLQFSLVFSNTSIAASAPKVATLSIYVTGTTIDPKGDVGHAWLAIKNIGSETLDFCGYPIKQNQTITVSLYGDNTNFSGNPNFSYGGAYLNLDYCFMSGREADKLSYNITKKQFDAIVKKTPKESYYSDIQPYLNKEKKLTKEAMTHAFDDIFHNCTTYATKMWNMSVPRKYQLYDKTIVRALNKAVNLGVTVGIKGVSGTFSLLIPPYVGTIPSIDAPYLIRQSMKEIDGNKTVRIGSPKADIEKDIYYITKKGSLVPYIIDAPKVKVQKVWKTKVKLSWSGSKDKRLLDGKTNVTRYQIDYYSVDEPNKTTSISVGGDKTSYTVEGLYSATRYMFKIRAFYEAGTSSSNKIAKYRTSSDQSMAYQVDTQKPVLSFANTKKTINISNEQKLTVTVNGKVKQIDWSSSDTSVVSVTGGKKSATIKALKAGKATIEARTYDCYGNVCARATCIVTVKDAPIYIKSVSDLKKVADIPSGTYYLTKNLSLSGQWTPIGTPDKPFTGKFYGKGHRISNLKISSGSDYQGFFGVTNGAKITGVYVSGSVSGTNYVGGLIGYAGSETIVRYCVSNVKVSGANQVGGIIGRVAGCNVDYCINMQPVTATQRGCGGITADIYPRGTIDRCINLGNVSGGNDLTGGINGGSTDGKVTNCFNAGNVTAKSGRIGAIAGDNASYAGERKNNYFRKTSNCNEKFSVVGTGGGTFTSNSFSKMMNLKNSIMSHFTS